MIIVFLLALVLVLVLRQKRKKQRPGKGIEVEDENPVYRMYEFADGGNIDAGTCEVVDDNDYYGS